MTTELLRSLVSLSALLCAALGATTWSLWLHGAPAPWLALPASLGTLQCSVVTSLYLRRRGARGLRLAPSALPIPLVVLTWTLYLVFS